MIIYFLCEFAMRPAGDTPGVAFLFHQIREIPRRSPLTTKLEIEPVPDKLERKRFTDEIVATAAAGVIHPDPTVYPTHTECRGEGCVCDGSLAGVRGTHAASRNLSRASALASALQGNKILPSRGASRRRWSLCEEERPAVAIEIIRMATSAESVN